jgi:hypothetical protein
MRRLILIALLIAAGMAQATTYYVQPGTGNDGNLGTSAGAGNSWATTQKALDTVIAGDDVRLCQSATETTTAQVDADGTTGTDASPILFHSYNSDGTTQTDGYTLQATASITSLMDVAAITNYHFVGIKFDANSNATSACYLSNSGAAENTFDACEFYNANSNGLLQNTTEFNTFVECHFYDNGASGVASLAVNRGVCSFIGGSAHDNTTHGVSVDDNFLISNMIAYDNTSDGFHLDARNAFSEIKNCVAYNNTNGDGIALTNQPMASVVGCAMGKNGGYGLSVDGGEDYTYIDYNWYGSGADVNTSGETDVSGGTPGRNNQTGVAGFADAGSGDFTPGTGSPLIGNGVNDGNIGAVAHADGGSGTTIIVVED